MNMGRRYCSEYVYPAMNLLLLVTVVLATLGFSIRLSIFGYTSSFQESEEDKILSFTDKLLAWFRYIIVSVILLSFTGSSIAWFILFVTSKLELYRKGISKNRIDSHEIEIQSNVLDEKSVKDDVESGHFYLQKMQNSEVNLQLPGCGGFVAIFVGLFCASISIVSLILSILVTTKYIEEDEPTVAPFHAVDLLGGILTPVMFLISAFITVATVDYHTGYKLNSQLMLARLLPAVAFKITGTERYWIINKKFRLNTTCGKGELQSNYLMAQEAKTNYGLNSIRMITPSYSTLLLCGIVMISVTLSFSFFIDTSLVLQWTLKGSCYNVRNMWYSCFESGDLDYVDCSHATNATSTLYCYAFNKYWFSSLVIVSTGMVYILVTFRVMDIIYVVGKFRRFSQHFGIILVTGGIVLLFAAISMFVIWQTRFSSVSTFLRSYLNILHLMQLILISLYILILGLLVKEGKWVETEQEGKRGLQCHVSKRIET